MYKLCRQVAIWNLRHGAQTIAATIRFRFLFVGLSQLLFMSSMSNYEVRPATLRDAKTIAEIDANASQAHWREAIEFSEPQVCVAIDNGQIVGFVGFDRSRDKGTPPTTGEIWNIKVAATHLGQGVGLALWDAAREGLLEEGCTTVTLWLPLGSERALRFHELAGFKREMSSIKTVPLGTTRVEAIRLKRSLS
jgi:ribosomal protein S18 acetylase RimI-like enzyme